ncbi:MAG: tyrosine recombinase XerD [Deltaproteobacteria bacterium]|nr:tyrosine recombinase XerD [Deltaproteobacteria bacterium]
MMLTESIDNYLIHLQIEKGRALKTLEGYGHDLSFFVNFIETGEYDFTSLRTLEATEFTIFLGDKLSKRSIARVLSAVRGFYRYLQLMKIVEENPFNTIKTPGFGKPLPRVFSLEEIDRVINVIDTSTPRGLRDKAMVELLYATGLRVSELVSLKLADLDFNQNILYCIGKGEKMRYVPFGRSARLSVEEYIKHGRIQLSKKNTASPWLFPGRSGKPLTRQGFWKLLSEYARLSGIDDGLSPHKIRHSFATHILERGGDIRSVQSMLGHQDLSTTQIYTHLVTDDLKTAHKTHHPRG